MKKSFNVNMGTASFNFDEDALAYLESYLERISQYYKGRGEELKVNEAEENIAALLLQSVGPDSIVTLEILKNVLEKIELPVGAAEDFVNEAADEKKEKKKEEEKGTGEEPYANSNEPWRVAMMMGRKLMRHPHDSLLGGVLAGFASYNGWDAGVLRLLVSLAFVFGIALDGISLILLFVYCVLWIALPKPRSIIDFTRMQKLQPASYSKESLDEAWKLNYERCVQETAFPTRTGCLVAGVRIVFFILLAIMAIPMLFVIGIILFVFGILLLALFENLGAAIFANIYVVLLLLLPLFALVHWVLKKCGVCRPLNGYLKATIIACWFAILVFVCYKVHNAVAKRGGWEQITYSFLDDRHFLDENFWERMVNDVLDSESYVYISWDDTDIENGTRNMPFAIDLKHNTTLDNVRVRFFAPGQMTQDAADENVIFDDVTELNITHLDNIKQGSLFLMWDSTANEILVDLQRSTLGASMQMQEHDIAIRWLKQNDSINFFTAMQHHCMPIEIRFDESNTPALYLWGNDSVPGILMQPKATHYIRWHAPGITVHTTCTSDDVSADDTSDDETEVSDSIK